MRTTCLHEPKRWVPTAQKHKDGTAVMRCADCLSTWRRQNRNKKMCYDDLFQKQNGLCAFCARPLDAESNRTHRDHSHVTGQTRGLVHSACNQMIGGIENAVSLVGWARIRTYLA